MTPQEEARPPTSSSMEEVATCPPKLEERRRAKRPEEVRAPKVKKKPQVANLQQQRASPPQSALRADSSSIEEERGAKSWLRQRASQLRKETTPHEKAMWRLLHDGELVSLNWRRQAALGNYIADFVSHPARLVVEIDGSQHAEATNAKHDAQRDAWFAGQGYRVLRFWNADVMKATQGVWDAIHEAAAQTPARARMQRWRERDMARAKQTSAQLTSSSMEEVAAKRPEEVRAPPLKKEPPEAFPQTPLAPPPQSALRADSSSIEEEQR